MHVTHWARSNGRIGLMRVPYVYRNDGKDRAPRRVEKPLRIKSWGSRWRVFHCYFSLQHCIIDLLANYLVRHWPCMSNCIDVVSLTWRNVYRYRCRLIKKYNEHRIQRGNKRQKRRSLAWIIPCTNDSSFSFIIALPNSVMLVFQVDNSITMLVYMIKIRVQWNDVTF